MIRDTIKNFNKQLEWEPVIENAKKLKRFKGFVVSGMGGSHLGADMLKAWKPDLDLIICSNYGLPLIDMKELKERLFIASSYSGNTEETISSLVAAVKNNISAAVVAAGGRLISFAQKKKLPYVLMPNEGIQPRLALGLNIKSMLALIGDKKSLDELTDFARVFKPQKYEDHGKSLARTLKGYAPVIYSSEKNKAIAYNWKIKFNETGKIPAFYNVLPELNHNEMTGFDVAPNTEFLSSKLHFIFLKDPGDHPRILRRMTVLEGLYRNRRLRVETLILQGNTSLQKIFSSIILADWTSYYTAKLYGVEPEQVPMVEEFKRLIR